jgi:hypothetical protein
MAAGGIRSGAGSETLGVGTRFALASLATWRLTHLLTDEDGPFDLVVAARARLGSGQLGELMDCFYCMSIWVAAPLSLTVGRRRDAPLVALALSGAACLVQQVTQPPGVARAEIPINGASDVLWTEAKRVESH